MLKEVVTNQYDKSDSNKEIRVELYSTKEEAMKRARRLRDTSTVLSVSETDWPTERSYNVTYTYSKRQ